MCSYAVYSNHQKSNIFSLNTEWVDNSWAQIKQKITCNAYLGLFFQTVVRADPHIGLLHRATEKLIEYKTFLQVSKKKNKKKIRNEITASVVIGQIPVDINSNWLRVQKVIPAQICSHL